MTRSTSLMKVLAGTAALGIVLAFAAFATGCAAVPEEIDTERDLDRAAEKSLGMVGRVVMEVAKIAPGAGEAIDGVDDIRRNASRAANKAKARRQDKRDSAFHDKLCAADPCNAWCVANRPVPEGFCGEQPQAKAFTQPYAGSGPLVVPVRSRGSMPSAASADRPAREQSAEPPVELSTNDPFGNIPDATWPSEPAAPKSLRQTLKDEEGGPLLVITKGHVCWGHSINENADKARFEGRTLSLAECEVVLTEDIEAAQARAKLNLGCETDPCIETCFYLGCNDFPDVAAAIAALEGIDTPRAARLARSLRG